MHVTTPLTTYDGHFRDAEWALPSFLRMVWSFWMQFVCCFLTSHMNSDGYTIPNPPPNQKLEDTDYQPTTVGTMASSSPPGMPPPILQMSQPAWPPAKRGKSFKNGDGSISSGSGVTVNVMA